MPVANTDHGDRTYPSPFELILNRRVPFFSYTLREPQLVCAGSAMNLSCETEGMCLPRVE